MLKLLVLFIGGMLLIPGTIEAKSVREAAKKIVKKIAVKKIAQKKCPVMDRKINPKLYYKYKNQKIYVCCRGCIAAVKKNPEKYLKKVQKEIAAAGKKTSGTKKASPKTAVKTAK